MYVSLWQVLPIMFSLRVMICLQKIKEIKVIDHDTKSNEQKKPFPAQVDFNRNLGSGNALSSVSPAKFTDRQSRAYVAQNWTELSASLHYFYLALPQSCPKPCSKSTSMLRGQPLLCYLLTSFFYGGVYTSIWQVTIGKCLFVMLWWGRLEEPRDARKKDLNFKMWFTWRTEVKVTKWYHQVYLNLTMAAKVFRLSFKSPEYLSTFFCFHLGFMVVLWNHFSLKLILNFNMFCDIPEHDDISGAE